MLPRLKLWSEPRGTAFTGSLLGGNVGEAFALQAPVLWNNLGILERFRLVLRPRKFVICLPSLVAEPVELAPYDTTETLLLFDASIFEGRLLCAGFGSVRRSLVEFIFLYNYKCSGPASVVYYCLAINLLRV
jgi:hypothetical protein